LSRPSFQLRMSPPKSSEIPFRVSWIVDGGVPVQIPVPLRLIPIATAEPATGNDIIGAATSFVFGYEVLPATPLIGWYGGVKLVPKPVPVAAWHVLPVPRMTSRFACDWGSPFRAASWALLYGTLVPAKASVRHIIALRP